MNNKSKKPQVLYLTNIIYDKDNKSNNNNSKIYGKLSGSEPNLNLKKWNDNDKIKQNHNCYSYALNNLSHSSKGKAQPGYSVGYESLKKSDYNCKTFYERLKKDNPALYKITYNSKCKKGFHKAFIALDTRNDMDYHFYRQDSNQLWSHKPGRTNATNLDASGKKIINPMTADRKYQYYNYDLPCFFFCVNPKFTRAHSKQKK